MVEKKVQLLFGGTVTNKLPIVLFLQLLQLVAYAVGTRGTLGAYVDTRYLISSKNRRAKPLTLLELHTCLILHYTYTHLCTVGS